MDDITTTSSSTLNFNCTIEKKMFGVEDSADCQRWGVHALVVLIFKIVLHASHYNIRVDLWVWAQPKLGLVAFG